ncbi:hypothetical protein P781_15420 [Vibrio mimicus CAIM 1883]|nr:hypothetical protein P780_15420 [Vibrio mimicus CAIM 1882]ERM53856.1 hypothetical protein P781_15420 [Vibrio mimicus CAIM 1883]
MLAQWHTERCPDSLFLSRPKFTGRIEMLSKKENPTKPWLSGVQFLLAAIQLL